jgi:ADP-ribose pyrophosphatase YjhB (NUDIX family)
MERRYEVYIEGRPLVISDAAPDTVIPEGMQVVSIDSDQALESVLEKLQHPGNGGGFWLHPNGVQLLWDMFMKRFKFVQAAGGVVQDENGRLLMIKRLGKWDLPKGKVDEGEGIPEAALREVEEECGIDELKITDHLMNTWHTYERKGRQHLKRTDWFLMQGSSEKTLTPQTDEDIEEVGWMTWDEIDRIKNETYPSLVKVLKAWEESAGQY